VQPSDLELTFSAIAALGTIIAAVAAVAAFLQVRLMRLQLTDSRDWNRMSFALDYLARREDIAPFEKALNASFLRFIDRTDPLSPDELRELLLPEHGDLRHTLSRFLNALESYCTAVNLGIADDEVAERIYGYKLARHFQEMRPYIDHIRSARNEPSLYCELEGTVTKWQKRPASVARYPRL
jgi:hypothetical protein